jgi:hypothetical protein
MEVIRNSLLKKRKRRICLRYLDTERRMRLKLKLKEWNGDVA